MKVTFVISISLFLLLGISARASEYPMPVGVGVRLTIVGPTFVDARGMTLYKSRDSRGDFLNACSGHLNGGPQSTGAVDGGSIAAATPGQAIRHSCIEKYPPLQAPEGARSIGKWTVVVRNDGVRQWAYDGDLLYTSKKDKLPGETNGVYPARLPGLSYSRWAIAAAPLVGVPSDISTNKTAAGLALANKAGKTLYYSDRQSVAGSSAWRPLSPPALATADRLSGWSIVNHMDGSRQWAYKGKPLYTYAYDSESSGDQIFADAFGGTYAKPIEGWHVALLMSAPRYPAGITIHSIEDGIADQHTVEKNIYTSNDGKTLYTIHCIEQTEESLDCDDVGDSPQYWLRFCGGEIRCAELWRPFEAPASAKSIDSVWSVVLINARHPWQYLGNDVAGLRVWAYRGRPVFTYAHDFRPGDCNGSVQLGPFPIGGRFILAYDSDRAP